MRHTNPSSFFDTFFGPYPDIANKVRDLVELEIERNDLFYQGVDVTEEEISEMNRLSKTAASHLKNEIEKLKHPYSKNWISKLIFITETIKKSSEFNDLRLVLLIPWLLQEVASLNSEQTVPLKHKLDMLIQGFNYQVNQLLDDSPVPMHLDDGSDEPGSAAPMDVDVDDDYRSMQFG